MYVITIDAGTSNTRATLWQDNLPISSVTEAVGCRHSAMTASKDKLKYALKKVMTELICRAGLTDSQIDAAVASGMITSNMGLYEMPHIGLPAGKEQLAQSMSAGFIPEVWPEKIWFVPGLKQTGDAANWNGIASLDVMRGEETEVIALLDRLGLAGKAAWIALPGSHYKYVYVNNQAQVEAFFTTLTGEMYAAVAGNTILADSVSVESISGQASKDLLAGAKAAAEMGLGRACFVVRLAHLFGKKSAAARGNFLLGAILASDINLLKQKDYSIKTPDAPIIVAGRAELKTAVTALLRQEAQFKDRIITADEKTASHLAGHGALLLAKERGII